MKYLAYLLTNSKSYSALFLGLLVYFSVSQTVLGQQDAFGTLDKMYIENVSAQAGKDVVVRFYMQNDEPISSASVPLTYNTEKLTLKSIDFTGSRINYISNKFTSPYQFLDINGHFVVSFFTISENYVSVGDGLLFTATFTLSNSAVEGESLIIDTLFYPPGGELVFVEGSQSAVIKPEFIPGSVTVAKENFGPTISAVSSETAFEGDSISFIVSANDSNNDSLVFVCTNKPTGSNFEIINGTSAKFSWKPDFLGPYSSDGSPFKLNLWVSDGTASAETEVLVHVINKNRKPIISTASQLSYQSGDLVELNFDASDADFDLLNWDIISLPQGAQFTEGSPSVVTWQTTLTDTGSFPIEFVITDPSGYADTLSTAVYLQAVSSYDMSISSAFGYPGEQVSVNINLNNMIPIGSFNLLVNYDPSALIFLSVTNNTSRSASFEYFTYTNKEDNIPGNVRINAVADQSGNNAVILPVGDGSLATMNFKIYGDISLSNQNIPVKFVFLDAPTKDDNTFTDTSGNKVVQEAITYQNGAVQVGSLGVVNIGDVNLNGIAFDIGDAIYFTNYFMNPFSFPFNPLQFANSDVNRDNIVGSIADLITMIQVISNGGQYNGKTFGTEKDYSAHVYSQQNEDGILLSYDTDFRVGGMLVTFSNNGITKENIENLADNMTLLSTEGSELSRILIYSPDGLSMPDGKYEFVQLHLESDIEIVSVDMATSNGELVLADVAHKGSSLPTSFELAQNYPNPFNPETNISFSLPEQTNVSLEIYNVLGEKVRVLIHDSYDAGQHVVVWDGKNDNGSEVSSGIYFYRMQTEANFQTKKMLFLK